MITKEELTLAKNFLEEARKSALYAHEAWCNVLKSEKELRPILRHLKLEKPGIFGSYDDLVFESVKTYQDAYKYFLDREREYKKLLNDFENLSI